MTPERSIPGYKLLHLLGRGHTALVHLAQDPQGRQVALKIPLEETLRVQEAAERFGNEVRMTLQFRHPQVVQGYTGTAYGPKAFVALRHYPEGTLCDVLTQRAGKKLPLEEALRVLADVASGLTYLHRLGAVHQDVKTQNVYLDGGRAALGDLGSAYFTAQGGQSSGSPYYMAPEIYHGESSSSASDVYSLGVLAYELLSGQRPHQGDTYEELMVAHLNRFAPPLSHLNPQVPRSVARLAELALAKRPQDRPPAEILRRALLAALGEPAEEEDAEAEAAPPIATTPTPRQMGRHGPVTPRVPTQPVAAGEAPGAATTEERGSARWNPFKRRK
ncbi:serine/threonine protein kinase [Deinococcus phoenicis]|uniref:Serine/threonine protein kinase n=1 Tax=Deinococcus phoenicis TaxID=1476583 RepID=A0A016QT41_9DEIO|nr:serine/threonine-protein kinase [Deinococcus phoenicis]EYB69295.1 serine/threonine protein kinase [Deinococcus phoenicis]